MGIYTEMWETHQQCWAHLPKSDFDLIYFQQHLFQHVATLWCAVIYSKEIEQITYL